MTLREVAAAVDGTLVDVADPERPVTAEVTADSRLAAPGGVFAAFAGEHADGHDFAADALAAGAVAVLAGRPVDGPTIVVDDVLLALGRWARALLDRLPEVTVVGVTGSAGKTTAKDLLASALERLGPTIAPPGSFNNELGLPLTVLRADAGTRWLVLEMGARDKGHLAYLCDIARPRIGVELLVGDAHVGMFGDRDAIAAAKAELVHALPEDGLAVLNGDDPRVRAMATQTAADCVFFGHGDDVDVRATDVTVDHLGRPRFVLHAGGEVADVSLQLVGEHHVGNALAAATVAWRAGMSVTEVADVLSSSRARSRWRMEVTERADGVIVINDAYNASPEAVRAALKALVSIAAGRRSWAVLGEMRELGDASVGEHDAIGRLAVRLDVSRLVVVGEAARPMHLGAALEGSFGNESVVVADVDAAIALLQDEVQAGDVVLVKASRAVGLERVAEALLASVPATTGGASA
jgi:UDP-N-acetylmuramoyl-tripeptide--D-alanyl-D-alanine ligase